MHRWDLVAPPVSGLVRPVRIDACGVAGPTRGASGGPRWRRTSPGLFVPATVDRALVEQRIVEVGAWAASFDGGPAVVTGWAALRLLGGGWFDGLAGDGRTLLPVQVAANGTRLRTMADVVVCRDTQPHDEVLLLHGVLCANAERAIFDELRRHVKQPRRMVAVIDMACSARLTSLRRLRRYVESRRWYRDRLLVKDPLQLAVEDSRSALETAFRMIWVLDAGWKHPLCNRGILGPTGYRLGTPDLLDPERGIVGEFAGADHRDVDQHQRDIGREADFRAVGLEYVEVVARDLGHRDRVVRRLREAEERAGVHPQTWSLAPRGPSLDQILEALERAE